MQDAKNRHLGTIAQLCQAISSQLRMYRQSEKNLLNSNTSSTCPDSMVDFGPLAAEIGSAVWGAPANFNGFRILAALPHGTLVSFQNFEYVTVGRVKRVNVGHGA